MGRVLIIAEGQTEEKFLKNIVFPYFYNKELFNIDVTILPSKITASGKRFKGGDVKSEKIITYAKKLISSAYVTTFIDYYGINENFIGYQKSLKCPRIEDKKNCLEHSLINEFNHRKFFPYIQMFEFEGLLFSDVNSFIFIEDNQDKINKISNEIKDFETPEHINNSKLTAPSKRLEKWYPSYGKTTDGIIVAESIGMTTLLNSCPFFSDWINKIGTKLKE